MKKTLAILLTLAMLVTGLSTFGVLAEGTEVVEINTAKEFVELIAADSDGSFILMKNIDFADYNGDGAVDATDAADIAAGPVSNFNGDVTEVTSEGGKTTYVPVIDEKDSALLATSTVNADGVRVYKTPYIVETFDGKLNGNGKTISGFAIDSDQNVDTGLIRSIGDNKVVEISDLNIGAPDKMISVSATGGYGIGCLGGATMQLKMDNVKLYANVNAKETSTGNYCLGGFFGASKNLTLTNCEVYGSVRSDSTNSKVRVGGFAGRSVKNVRATFTDCINYANITVSGVGNNQMAGGFIGMSENATAVSETFNRCINYGTIKTEVTDPGNAKLIVASGFAAYCEHPIYINNCVNYGSIDSQNWASAFVAGGSSTVMSVTNSVNFGAITATNIDKAALTTNTNNVTLTLPDTHKGYTPSASVNFVGSQESEPAENLFNARFLAVVDGLEYTSVGFEIVAYTDTDANGTLEEWEYTHGTNNVYDAVKGTDRNGDPYEATAEELGGDYIYALATTAIPANCGTVVFIIKPYATIDKTTFVYGAAATCVYTNGVFSSISYVN